MTTICTNHHVYKPLYYHELNAKQKKQVDSAYGGLIGMEEAEFCFYRDNPYFMGDCMRLEHNTEFKDYDGYFSDTYFSIVLVKYVPDEDGYKFAFAYS